MKLARSKPTKEIITFSLNQADQEKQEIKPRKLNGFNILWKKKKHLPIVFFSLIAFDWFCFVNYNVKCEKC